MNYISINKISTITIDDLYQESLGNFKTNIAVAPAEGITGASVNLVATLTDKYNKAIQGKPVQFTVAGTPIGTPVTTDVNGIAKLSYTITQTISGTYTILAQFLGDNIYAATSNTNNLKVDYTPTLPDLTVSNLQIPTNPTTGQTYPITVTVSNLGQTDAGTFSNKLYDGTTQIGEIILNSLKAGTNTPITFNWIPTTSGTHTLKIITDANNQITETNENNNQITQDTTVTVTSPTANVQVWNWITDSAGTYPGKTTINYLEDNWMFIQAHNWGPDSATGVILTDIIPSTLNFDPTTLQTSTNHGQNWITNDPTVSLNGNTLTWNINNMINGADLWLKMKIQATNTGTQISNTVTETQTTNNPNPQHQTDTATVTVP